ncbi:hypothetical protein [Enterobacter kobei]|uniref:hypothetical protein n=1 Tax=Enterobacter kobei TaxID=208224 RepID=UPI003BF63F83
MLKLQDPGFGTRRYSDDAYKHCQVLQSEKEGVTRPTPEAYSREKYLFADRIRQAIGYTRQLQHLLPYVVAQYLSSAETEQ